MRTAATTARTATQAIPSRKEAIMAPTASFHSSAYEAGFKAGTQVLSGKLTVEAAGDRWVRHADRSHRAGVEFMRGYDASGAEH